MKRIALFLLAMGVAGWIMAQSDQQKRASSPNSKKINYGIKLGFNSSIFLPSGFHIKDLKIKEIQNNYLTGYFGALFMRIQMDKQFLQPEISYNSNKSEMEFDKLGSTHVGSEPAYASVRTAIHSIDFPLLYGFHIVKDGPYGMSIFVGPKLRYIWSKKSKTTFVNFDQIAMQEELYPFNANAVVGVSINISQVFFDFRYEQGLNNISKSITYNNPELNGERSSGDITLNRRDNVLSFSLGVIF